MRVEVSWPMVAGVIGPNIGGWAGGYFTRSKLRDGWYHSLKKPSWTPPDWAFAPTWTVLYSTLGYSSYIVWRDGGGFQGATIPLAIYTTSLAFNFAWTPIFFGARNIKLALYEILAVLGTTVGTAVAFYKVNPLAGYLNIPLIAWTTFAAALNYSIYKLNQPAITATEESKKN